MEPNDKDEVSSFFQLMKQIKEKHFKSIDVNNFINKIRNETDLESLVGECRAIRNYSKIDEGKKDCSSPEFISAVLFRLKSLKLDDSLSNLRAMLVSILNSLIDDDNNRKLMVENGIIPVLIDTIDYLPPTMERKLLNKIFSFIAEDVWFRDEIVNYLKKKYPTDTDLKNWEQRVLNDPVDSDEKDFFLDVLKFTDLTLEAYKPGKAFYETEKFNIARILEENYETIKKEVLNIQNDNLVSWPEKYLCQSGWDVLGMFAFNNKIPKNEQICPETFKILESIPGMVTAMFSCLKPRTHIKPHVGYYQYSEQILRCHLGIIIPDGCCLKVNGQTRSWEEGKCLIFDDTFRHEAWNANYDKTRIVLMVDFVFDGNVSDRNPDFFASEKKNKDDMNALISQDTFTAIFNLIGSDVNNAEVQ